MLSLRQKLQNMVQFHCLPEEQIRSNFFKSTVYNGPLIISDACQKILVTHSTLGPEVKIQSMFPE